MYSKCKSNKNDLVEKNNYILMSCYTESARLAASNADLV